MNGIVASVFFDSKTGLNLISLNMPYGDSMGEVVKTLAADGNLRGVIIAGAAGYIPAHGMEPESAEATYQTYQMFNAVTSSDGLTTLTIDPAHIVIPHAPCGGVSGGGVLRTHQDVTSFMQETTDWMGRVKDQGGSSVDMEMFSLVEAVNRHNTVYPDAPICITPGVAISDVLGVVPYTDLGNAYRGSVPQVLDAARQQMVERLRSLGVVAGHA